MDERVVPPHRDSRVALELRAEDVDDLLAALPELLAQVRGAWREGLVFGVINGALPFTLIAWGETHIDSGIAAIANASVPMVTRTGPGTEAVTSAGALPVATGIKLHRPDLDVFVVMGDPTAIGDYPEAMDNYDLVPSGLIKLVKQGFNMGVDHSGTSIGQPTSFFVGAALNLCPPEPEQEIKNLHRKIKNGADFFLTQPIYEPEKAMSFLDQYASVHGKLDKPVLVGVLPLVSLKHANFLHHEVPGISIPDETLKRMEEARDGASRVGVELAVELIQSIKPWAQGVYIMPQFNRFDLIAEIVEAVK